MDKQKIQIVLDYLEKVNKARNVKFGYKITKTGVYLSNPIKPFNSKDGKLSASTTIIPGSNYVFSCPKENRLGDIVEVAMKIDSNTKGMSKEEVAHYLSTKHNIVLEGPTKETYLKAYEYYGFDLVPIVAKGKAPFELDWVNKEYKHIDSWRNWLDTGFNIGIKTGSRSGITVVDIDSQDIPECLRTVDTLIQKTNKGYHFVFKYESDLPNYNMRYNKKESHNLPIEILNDGRQFVAHPSVVNEISRKWNFYDYKNKPILQMPEEVKKFLLDHIETGNKTSLEDKIKEDIINDKVEDLSNLTEGGRNVGLTKLGGVLRKQLNIDQTAYVMNLINRSFVKPSLSNFELRTIVNSLDKYSSFDDMDLVKKIHDYLRYAEEGLSRDIQAAIGESKARIDKALAYLIKEQIIVKRGRMYHLIKKADWVDTFPSLDLSVNFKMPYFHDIANFSWGDMILLGGKSKVGKTTISMNFVKSLVEQGIKPYYICLETGSRFIKTAAKLEMKEGDFFWSIQTDPTKIEIENNSITILDWLLIEDKAKTDSVMQYFVNQLVRTNSLLIVFMQLKDNGEWFAPNMVKQFPAFAARYIYEKDEDGTAGSWHIDAIREAKRQVKKWTIPCQYNWEDRRLRRVDELSDYRIKKTEETTEEIVA